MDITTSYLTNFTDDGQISRSAPRNIVSFFIEPLHHEQKSIEAGRPVYHDVEMVRIIVPGDMKSVVVRRSTVEDQNTYPREYEAFKRNTTIATEGTPIEHWNILTRSQVATLKHVNVLTIEALAGLSDDALSNLGILGSRTLRKQAQIYLSQAADGSEAAKMVHRNEQLELRVKALENQLTNASAAYEKLAREKGHDPSADSFTNPVMLHPQVAAQAAPPVAAGGPEIPAHWQTLKDPELIKLARSLSPAPVKSRADAVAVIEEIISDKALAS